MSDGMERSAVEQARLHARLARYEGVKSPQDAPAGSELAGLVADASTLAARYDALLQDAGADPDVVATARERADNAALMLARAWEAVERAREVLTRTIPVDDRTLAGGAGQYASVASEAWESLSRLDAPRVARDAAGGA